MACNMRPERGSVIWAWFAELPLVVVVEAALVVGVIAVMAWDRSRSSG